MGMIATRTPVSKVRLTATQSVDAQSANAMRGHVWRISVATLAALGSSLTAQATAAEKDSWTIRIVPAFKSFAPPAPMIGRLVVQNGPPKATPGGTPPMMEPPVAKGTQGPRIIPSRRGFLPLGHPNFYDIYRTIPFSRAEYEANPSYRSQATMAILLQLASQAPYPHNLPPGGGMNPNAPAPKPGL